MESDRAIGGALLAVVVGFALTHKSDAKRLERVDEIVKQALAEQKKQTTIQEDLGQRFDKARLELDSVKTYLQTLDQTVSQGIEKLQEQENKKVAVNDQPANDQKNEEKL